VSRMDERVCMCYHVLASKKILCISGGAVPKWLKEVIF
jgi:hypothetical protein